jgi:hypothetical protein
MATNREMLKEAIADAKAVKETAIANAKAALEEAFTPQLTSMLSMKLQEMEEEDLKEEGFGKMNADSDEGLSLGMDEKALDEEEDKMMEIDLEELLAELNEEEDMDEAINEAEEEEEDEESEESEEGEEEGEPIELEDMTDEDLKSMIEDVIKDMIEAGELEAGHEGEEGEEEAEGEEEIGIEDEEEIDLAELLREIEDMDEEKDMMKEEEIEEGFMDKIVKAVNRFGSSGAVEDLIKIDLPKVVAAGKKLGKLDPSYEPNEEEINKLTASAKEDGGTGSIKIMGDKVVYIPGSETRGAAQASTFESMKSELDEAYSAIETLKNELNEINLLNAKLLYTNKIFKAKNLNESQKVKVLSSFDKAKNVGEVKMVFETLNEGIKVSKNTIKEHLGSASKTTNTPSVKKPIVESNEAFLRMQKLAGII